MISIALATYNGSKYLPAQLESLANQQKLPNKLVICDDRSTDDTLSIAKSFAKSAPFPVHVDVNSSNLGFRENFFKAASLCDSDYIAFCDQDDIWHPDKLKIATEVLSGRSYMLFQHGYDLIDGQGRALPGLVKPPSPDRWINSRGMSQIFHRSLLDYDREWRLSKDDFDPSEMMGHDKWISFLAPILGQVYSTDDALLSYRQHERNAFGFQYRNKFTLLAMKIKTAVSIINRRSDHFKERFEHFKSHARGWSAASSSLVEVLRSLLGRINSAPIREHIVSEIAYYERSADYFSRRFELYGSAGRLKKLQQLIGLAAGGSYNRRGIGGMKDGALDLFFGVLE